MSLTTEDLGEYVDNDGNLNLISKIRKIKEKIY